MSQERPKPYVGISGIVNERKVMPDGLVVIEPPQIFLEAAAERSGLADTGRQLMLGVKAMHSTQFADRPHARKGKTYGPEWFPVGEQEFANALGARERHLGTLGTAQVYLHPLLADNALYRDYFMHKIGTRGADWMDAVQFDGLRWHEHESYLKFAQEARQQRDFQVILQVNNEQMDIYEPHGIVRKMGKFAASFDYLLFDASEGLGKGLDSDRLSYFLEAVYNSDELADKNFAVAGGLDATTVKTSLPKLLERFPDISWDAETKLHPLNNANKEPLQIDAAKAYIQTSVDALRLYQ